jgi:hypothetical protein
MYEHLVMLMLSNNLITDGLSGFGVSGSARDPRIAESNPGEVDDFFRK